MLLLLHISICLPSLISAGTCTPTPAYTPCPTALAAAKALTGNNPKLPVVKAAWSGICDARKTEAMYLITSFGCHYLAAQMPQGKARCC
jgi:hypothetical protein